MLQRRRCDNICRNKGIRFSSSVGAASSAKNEHPFMAGFNRRKSPLSPFRDDRKCGDGYLSSQLPSLDFLKKWSRVSKPDQPKMKPARLTITLLFGLSLMTGGCATSRPAVSSYFHPSPDEVVQNQAANSNSGKDNLCWDILYFAFLFGGTSLANK